MADLGNPETWLPGKAGLDVIRTEIAAYNAERPAIARAQTRRVLLMMGGFAIAGIAAGAAAIASGSGFTVGVTLGLVIVGGRYVWGKATEPARRFQQDLRQRLFPVIFGFIPDFRYATGLPPRFLPRFEQTKLLAWQSARHDDGFSGAHDGLEVELSETEFFIGFGKNKSSLFKGLILHIRRQSAFDGVLLAQQKANAVQRFFRDLFGTELRSVGSGLASVDETHEFRTDREGPEQQRLSIEIAKALDWLQQFWRHGPAQIALTGNDCYLLLAAEADHFELPPIQSGDIDFDRDVLPLIKDMVTLLAIAHLINKIGAE